MTGEPKYKICSHFYKSLDLIIHKENAPAIFRRCSVTLEARQILSTAALLQSGAAEDAP